MKIIFFGTPQIAAQTLESLIKDPTIQVQAVVTQPDKPTGRKQILTPPPVKTLAQENQIPVFQPQNKKELKTITKTFDVDFFVIMAYGFILPQSVIDQPKIDSINIHVSLLPKHRGASPIQNSLLQQDHQTGISIMSLTLKMDSGPIYQQIKTPITKSDNTETLGQKLSQLSQTHLPEILKKIKAKQIKATPQTESQATYCHKITKKDGEIKQNHTSEQILQMIKAYHPWPETYFYWNNQKITIISATPSSLQIKEALTVKEKSLLLKTANASLKILSLKPAGKNIMSAQDFINGNHNQLTTDKK